MVGQMERGARGRVSRRTALASLGAAATLAMAAKGAPGTARRCGVGLVTYCLVNRNAWRLEQKQETLFTPPTFLAHCASLGAGGIQTNLGAMDQEAAHALRAQAEAAGLYIEGISSVPKDESDIARFDAEMRTAAELGAGAVRTTIIPGRRYEYFESLAHYKEFDAQGRRALELAVPVVEKHRVRLAVENHKDHRNAERVRLLQHISNEYVGACVDMGNSFALLEDPIETVEALAPWAYAVHLKDQAVQTYEDGFLLDDIPLGQGFLDLKRMVAILRGKKPDVHFSLELITREPLKVPVLEDSYWRTFPDVPATDLARTLRMVRDGASEDLQYVDHLTLEARAALEEQNLLQSLDYAGEELGL